MATLVLSSGVLTYGGAIVKLSSGTVVVVFTDSINGIVAYKDAGGTPTKLGSTQTPSVVHGTYYTSGLHAAVDSSDVVHVFSVSSAVNASYRDMAYNTISDIDGTPTWGTWATVATYTDGPVTSYWKATIRIDSGDYPRVSWQEEYKYKGVGYPQCYYSHDVGSGWITKEKVNAGDTDISTWQHGMTVCSDDDVEVVWGNNVAGEIRYRRRNGSWGTEGTWSGSANTVIRNGAHRSSGDTVYRYAVDSADIYENDVDTSLNIYTDGTDNLHAVASMLGTYRWLAYVDTSEYLSIAYNGGSGWTNEQVVESTIASVIVADGYRNCGFSDGTIGYLYELGSGGVYYDEFSVGAATRSISVDDSITVSDTVVGVVLDPLSPVNISTSDSITVSDTPTVEVEALATPEIDVNDSVGISDTVVGISITSIEDLEIDVSDSLNISDSAIIAPLILAIAKAESVGVSDTVVGVDIGGAETVVPIFTMHYVKLRRS